MTTQYSNHRDTPLRRFNTFWWGMAYFGIFGLVSAAVVCWSGRSEGVEEVLKKQRLEAREAVDASQASLLIAKEVEAGKIKQVPPAEVFGQVGEELQKAPAAGNVKVPVKIDVTGGDAAKGKELWTSKTCFTCHGADANTPLTPNYPKLAGQDAAYTMAQMKDFHEGKRTNGLSAVMTSTLAAVKLTDDENKDIAAWLSSLESPDVTQADDAGKKLYTAKTCVACHGADGNKPLMAGYPKLKGQSAQYMIDQLKAFKDGTRNNGQAKTMSAIMGTVSDEEIKILAEWIAGTSK